MENENSLLLFSVSITHNSKPENWVMKTELWKQSYRLAKQPFCYGSYHFWVMNYGNWELSYQIWLAKQSPKFNRFPILRNLLTILKALFIYIYIFNLFFQSKLQKSTIYNNLDIIKGWKYTLLTNFEGKKKMMISFKSKSPRARGEKKKGENGYKWSWLESIGHQIELVRKIFLRILASTWHSLNLA